jgi:hypothetical protein
MMAGGMGGDKKQPYNPCMATDCVFNDNEMCALHASAVPIGKGGACTVYEPAGEMGEGEMMKAAAPVVAALPAPTPAPVASAPARTVPPAGGGGSKIGAEKSTNPFAKKEPKAGKKSEPARRVPPPKGR